MPEFHEEPEVTKEKPDIQVVKKPKKKRVRKLKLSSIMEEEYENESDESETDRKVEIPVNETMSEPDHEEIKSKSNDHCIFSKLEVSTLKLSKSVSMDSIITQIDSYKI